MVRIADIDLEKGPAIVAAIDREPLKTAKKAEILGADIVEIRLDLLGIRDADVAKDLVEEIVSSSDLKCIATNRLQSDGGRWEGPEEERIFLLEEIIPLVDGVDIELSAQESVRTRIVEKAKENGKAVIVSAHDFSKTPSVDEMKDILENAFEAGGDIAKLAVMPNSMQDVLDLLNVTSRMEKPVCTISMGELGKHTRVVAPCYGSVLTYGSVAEAVAPGQIRVDKVRECLETIL
jgi:3-dehydroquinate dehydratase-1